jgi:hypothetical protein
VVFRSKRAGLSLYIALALCSDIYLTNAMEQPTSALEEKTEEHISPFEDLASELKVYSISFLMSAESEQKAIRNIKALFLTSKEFYK